MNGALFPAPLKLDRRFQMVMYIARAIAWGLSHMLRIPRAEAISHRDLDHAHWDPTQRRWSTHGDAREGTVARAA